MVRVRVARIRVLICPSEPSRERVKLKVSHVIVECRMINHHPNLNVRIFNIKDSYYPMKASSEHCAEEQHRLYKPQSDDLAVTDHEATRISH